jgi:uncharacterized protein (DUF433 family)
MRNVASQAHPSPRRAWYRAISGDRPLMAAELTMTPHTLTESVLRDFLDDDEPKRYDRISVNPRVMVGKPVIRGTRIPVATVLRHLALTLDPEDVLAAYPSLTTDDLVASLRFAADLLDGEAVEPAFAPKPVLGREPA